MRTTGSLRDGGRREGEGEGQNGLCRGVGVCM